ncbi:MULTISPECIES: flagellar basal-body rod protein FlgF [unclassified Agarivorans]|uniref:flagellar basal-body rod protein FlgF n=1 Tax=unclassified Agarivorans TaxID=2636026 RepID=UPI0026E2EB23|nr:MULTISPECIES: flagellar basal-body rod protein FlgF [unclassified Agarivorans]MDO6685860.1 flagellar basal-body rod protein FlgF [Agarivorans sp. 3_MG-2023]MDO6716025.1 flagellar basal-body rod protein FlgF [Agarivorans sp. 2_MG-2023]
MLQAFYSGLSGLVSFSKGLNQLSNNVSNMNTPGFKAKDSFYQSVTGDNGTTLSNEFLREKQGDIRSTGNYTDLAIDGAGFFVLQDGANSYLTRAGQFTIDENNILVDKATGYAVSGIDKNGNLQNINITDNKFLPPEATSKVMFEGNISADGDAHSVENVFVFSRIGENLNYKFEFADRHAIYKTEKDADGEDIEVPTGEVGWTVKVKDANDQVVSTEEVRYSADGKIVDAFSQIEIEVPQDSANPDADKSTVTLDFSSTSGYAAGEYSDMSASAEDGHALAGLTRVSFDKTGSLKLSYSNGDDVIAGQVALANVNNVSMLKQESGVLFSAMNDGDVILGRADSGEFGEIIGESIELANVELAEEFADMMIVQRGYQASSHVMNIANEMIETLYNSGR